MIIEKPWRIPSNLQTRLEIWCREKNVTWDNSTEAFFLDLYRAAHEEISDDTVRRVRDSLRS
jgi:hypothetical protein